MPKATRVFHVSTLTGLLVCGFTAIAASSTSAATYYVAPNGSKGNSGTSLDQPFPTIQQAANVAAAGDTVYVRGGTYRETVSMQNSGKAGAPITFRPYADEQVTVTGLDAVAGGWSNYHGSVYKKTVASASQVFVNGQLMMEARWPNFTVSNPLYTAHAAVKKAYYVPGGVTSVVDSALIGAPVRTGAKMAINSGARYVTWSMPVISASQSGNAIGVQWPISTQGDPADFGVPNVGDHYYLYGAVGLVDAPNEYYHDASGKNLYLYAPGGGNPNDMVVELRTREQGFNISGSHVNVNGFRVKAASVKITGSHNRLDNCQVLYPSVFADPSAYKTNFYANPGVTLSGQGNTLSHSEVAYCWANAVKIEMPFNKLYNNIIHDANWSGVEAGAIRDDVGRTTITNNTIYNAGRAGVNHVGATTLTHNEIARYGCLTQDTGANYIYSTDGAGTVIAYNHVHDSCMPYPETNYNAYGIYEDGTSSNITIHHNLATNVFVGINMNGHVNVSAYNNTLWNVRYVQATSCYVTPRESTNVNNKNNISNKGGWVGTSVSNNITTAGDPFVDAAAGDYRLKSGNAAVDAGMVIPGITDGYTGSAPDVGAFESGVAPWIAGANWKAWGFGNQICAPITDTVAVDPKNGRTIGTLIAGKIDTTSLSTRRSFFKFDLSNVSRSIRSAKLRLYEGTTPAITKGGVGLRVVASTWTPSTVSYAQPVSDNYGDIYDPANFGYYTEIDVTSAVLSWLANPSTNHGFALFGNEALDRSAKYFDGRYSITPPVLVITFKSPDTERKTATTAETLPPSVKQIRVLQGLNIPECVCIDPTTGYGYVSNIVCPKGVQDKVDAKDGTGFIARLAPGGTIDVLRWVESTPDAPLNSIKGMCILNGILYAADIDRVVRYRLDSGKPEKPIPIPDAKLLNDMADDGKFVYVSDTITGKIHRIRGEHAEIAASLSGANGITFAGGRMYGVSVTEHEIYELFPDEKKTPRPFGLAKHFAGLDGIEVLADGGFLVSDCRGQKLFYVGADEKTVRPLAELAWPADICLDRRRNLLFVPLFWDSQVIVFKMDRLNASLSNKQCNPNGE